MKDTLLAEAARLLRPVPDFPKPGILFWDLQPILDHPGVLNHLIDLTLDRWKDEQVEVIASFDARGFILGALMAEAMDVPHRLIRKKGKLPPPTQEMSYTLEYGSATVEMCDDGFIDGKRVLLIDDLLATGGTAFAGAKLVEKLGGTVVGFSAITELPELGGRGIMLQYPVHSLISIIENTTVVDVEYCVDVLAFDHSSGALLLIERLNHPPGIAMPGGRIERESVMVAAIRELAEETSTTANNPIFRGVLAGLTRDPRGVKVSIVVEVTTDTTCALGEAGKTKVLTVASPAELPYSSLFVFEHGPFVYKAWAERVAHTLEFSA